MAEWRFGRGWRPREIAPRLRALVDAPRNFQVEEHEMTPESGWNDYFIESFIAHESAGGEQTFQRLARAVVNYQFSDPTIVRAHFDREAALLGRPMLLDIQALHLHYLCPVVVTAIRDENVEDGRVFGFCYETLDGHIETGREWFLLTKAPSGDIHFRIDARWRRGQFPNWWSRVGFRLLAKRYQRKWHRQAERRMIAISNGVVP
jgi:uncharacterized protein (UPF0548 family)